MVAEKKKKKKERKKEAWARKQVKGKKRKEKKAEKEKNGQPHFSETKSIKRSQLFLLTHVYCVLQQLELKGAFVSCFIHACMSLSIFWLLFFP